MAIQMLRKVITLFSFIVIDFKIITAEFRAHGGERPSRKYFIELHSYIQKPWFKRPGTGWGLAAAVVTPTELEVEGMCWGSFWGGGDRGTCCLTL